MNRIIPVLLLIGCFSAYVFADECTDPSMEINTDRSGMDYKNFYLNNSNPCDCMNACNLDPQCKAYTYVKPGVQGEKARCWLKNGVSDPVTDKPCCISGLKNTVMKIAEISSKPARTVDPDNLATFNSNPKKPLITNIFPRCCSNKVCAPYLIGGSRFIITGSNFGTNAGAVQIMLSKYYEGQEFMIPPKDEDNLIQKPVYPTSIKDDEIRASAPHNLDGPANLWLYIDKVGYSNALPVYINKSYNLNKYSYHECSFDNFAIYLSDNLGKSISFKIFVQGKGSKSQEAYVGAVTFDKASNTLNGDGYLDGSSNPAYMKQITLDVPTFTGTLSKPPSSSGSATLGDTMIFSGCEDTFGAFSGEDANHKYDYTLLLYRPLDFYPTK